MPYKPPGSVNTAGVAGMLLQTFYGQRILHIYGHIHANPRHHLPRPSAHCRADTGFGNVASVVSSGQRRRIWSAASTVAAKIIDLGSVTGLVTPVIISLALGVAARPQFRRSFSSAASFAPSG